MYEISDATRFVPVAGIGVSASGLDALEGLLAGLRGGMGMNLALVVIPHPEPTHPSMTAELLARHSPMSIRQLSGDVEVEAGVVYCLPPGGHVLLEGDVLRVVPPGSPSPLGLPLPIDRFFGSLAESRAELAIGIVLSGTGSDGMVGACAIKESGGIILVQDPEEAAHADMPKSVLRAGIADAMLPVLEIGPRSLRHVEAWLQRQREKEMGDVKPILERLREHSRQDFASYEASAIRRGVRRRMSLTQSETYDDYLAHVGREPREIDRLFRDLFAGVTEFFPEPAVGSLLVEKVVPQLVERASLHRPVRVWVPGCATGEEAVGLAIVLAEALARDREADFQIFATDVDERAIENARFADYSKSFVETLPEERRRFFELRGDRYVLARALRDKIVYSVQDLLSDPPFGQIDLISCRNLLIYLTPEAQRRALALLHFALKPEGVLVLGVSEAPTQQQELFDPLSERWRIYRRSAVPHRYPVSAFEQALSRRSGLRRPVPLQRHDATELTRRVLLERFAPVAVLLDGQDRVLYEHGPTEPYLGRPRGIPSHDLHGLLRPELKGRARRVLSQARKDKRVQRVDAVVGGDGRSVCIEAYPLPERMAPAGWALLSFLPGHEDSGPAAPPRATENPTLIEQLEQEVREARFDLQTLIEEYESSSEELKASSEEVLSMNEELQSSNEELEASKDELKALNEELGTVNDELQTKIAELERTHDDLANLVHSTRIPTVFLDNDLRIHLFTPAMNGLFNLLPADVGRPLGDLAPRFQDEHLIEDARRVLEELVPCEREVTTAEGRRLVRHVHPYRRKCDRTGGVVLTFVEVTKVQIAKEEATRRLLELEQLYQGSPVGLGLIDRSFRFVRCNERLAAVNGLPVSDHLGRTLREVLPQAAEQLEQLNRRVWETGEPIEGMTIDLVPMGHTEPSYLHASYFPLRDESGEIQGTLAAVIDITEREALKRSLDRSRARYLQLLKLLGGAVIETDDEGRVVFANPAASTLLGSAPVGVPFAALLPGAPKDALANLMSMGDQGESPILRVADGRRIKVFSRSLGEGARALHLLTDLSDELRHRERVQEQQKMEAVGRLAAGVAHDFNNLLQGLLMQAETIESLTKAPEILEETSAMTSAIERAAEVVTQLLHFGRSSQSEREVARLVDAARDAVKLARVSIPNSTKFTVSLPEGDVGVRMPRIEVTQLLLNLLTNAHQALVGTGRNEIRVEVVLPDKAQADACLRVTDSGVGMSEEVQRQLFEPYFTTKPLHEGTGLGLSVVHGVVERAGGRIVVRSREGEGTTFEVWLPVARTPDMEPVRNAVPRTTSGERVVIVDDEAGFARALARLLRGWGYQVEAFERPEDALARVVAKPNEVDALVTDMTMPMMSGVELIEGVRKHRPGLPAILCTGNSLDASRAAPPSGVVIVQKPLQASELVRALRLVLEPQGEGESSESPSE